MFLSVPIKETRHVTIKVIVMDTLSPSLPMAMKIILLKNQLIQDLKLKVAEKLGWDVKFLLSYELKASYIEKIYHDSDPISDISKHDTLVISRIKYSPTIKYQCIPIYLTVKKPSFYTPRKNIAYPLILSIETKPLSYKVNENATESEETDAQKHYFTQWVYSQIIALIETMLDDSLLEKSLFETLQEKVDLHLCSNDSSNSSSYYFNFWNSKWKDISNMSHLLESKKVIPPKPKNDLNESSSTLPSFEDFGRGVSQINPIKINQLIEDDDIDQLFALSKETVDISEDDVMIEDADDIKLMVSNESKTIDKVEIKNINGPEDLITKDNINYVSYSSDIFDFDSTKINTSPVLDSDANMSIDAVYDSSSSIERNSSIQQLIHGIKDINDSETGLEDINAVPELDIDLKRLIDKIEAESDTEPKLIQKEFQLNLPEEILFCFEMDDETWTKLLGLHYDLDLDHSNSPYKVN